VQSGHVRLPGEQRRDHKGKTYHGGTETQRIVKIEGRNRNKG
jgi:hypothetical protein